MDFRVRLKLLSVTLFVNLISVEIICENVRPKFQVSALFEYLPLPGSTIKLEDQRDYSAVIDLASSTTTDYSEIYLQLEKELEPKNYFEITIEAPSGHGIMAVIQELDLGAGGSSILFPDADICSNYIEFAEVGSTGHKTGRICGKFAKGRLQVHPLGLIGPRTFTSFSDKIVVKFFKTVFFSTRKNTLEIAFTAYKNFDLKNPNTTENMSAEGYQFCSDVSKNSTKTVAPAIKANLTCNSVINCGGQVPESFGTDESRLHCLMAINMINVIESANTEPSSLGSARDKAKSEDSEHRRKKTDATSFTTFVIVILIFIIFYGVPATCFIYHNAKLPAILQHARPSSYEDGEFSDESDESRVPDARPPAYESPPSYENLFPSSITQTT